MLQGEYRRRCALIRMHAAAAKRQKMLERDTLMHGPIRTLSEHRASCTPTPVSVTLFRNTRTKKGWGEANSEFEIHMRSACLEPSNRNFRVTRIVLLAAQEWISGELPPNEAESASPECPVRTYDTTNVQNIMKLATICAEELVRARGVSTEVLHAGRVR
jgi:hypothetical protein